MEPPSNDIHESVALKEKKGLAPRAETGHIAGGEGAEGSRPNGAREGSLVRFVRVVGQGPSLQGARAVGGVVKFDGIYAWSRVGFDLVEKT